MLIINGADLYRFAGEYVDFYNHARPHQGIEQRIPDPNKEGEKSVGESHGRIVGRPVLGGLHHDYRRVA